MQDFDKRIVDRTDDELIEILVLPEKWTRDAVNKAIVELTKRGIDKDEQLKRILYHRDILKVRLISELEEKRRRSFDIITLFYMVIKWPFMIFSGWSLKKDGYHLMHKQRLLAILTGAFIYIGFFSWAAFSNKEAERERVNMINNVDISEWEKEYYSESEIIEMRKKDIEKAKNVIVKNKGEDIETILLIEGDTINDEKLSALDKLDINQVKDVVIERYEKPDYHELIKILFY